MSEIITTLILVVIVFVAVGIVWGVTKNLLKESSEDVNIGKITTKLSLENVQISEKGANVKVKRDVGQGEMTGIKFVFITANSSEIIDYDVVLGELEMRSFNLSFSSINGSAITKMTATPILKSSSGNKDLLGTSANYNLAGACIANCAGLQCGVDPVCGYSCGTCASPKVCNASKQCEQDNILYFKSWNGLQAWWRMNGNGNDDKGSNTATLMNGVNCTVSGKHGNACKFDGVDDFVNVSSSPVINNLGKPMTNYSIVLWFNNSINADQSLTEKWIPWAQYPWAIRLDPTISKISFIIYDGNSSSKVESSSGYKDGQWHLIVAVRDSSANKIRLYIDSNSPIETTDGFTTTDISNLGSFPIGARFSTGGNYFNGSIDEVMIFNRVLNSTEISELYTLGY